MAGAPELPDFAKSEDPETATAAQWWLDQGPAIHDADAVAS